VARQVARWSKQYLASRVEETPAMDRLMEWLPANTPPNDEATLAHGDYRLGNLLFHPTEPRVIAVLDWELSTIGHPIGDLAYCCLTYHQTSDAGAGLSAAEAEGLGIPSEAQFVEAYRQRVGRASIPNWTFFLVFSLFRSASILAGVYKRSLDGNSVDARQARAREAYRDIAASAWSLARR
jgi:aminoglycoside phosphotransferase (APT) family kinase protein